MGLFNFNRTNSTDDILPAETSDENSVNKDELKKFTFNIKSLIFVVYVWILTFTI